MAKTKDPGYFQSWRLVFQRIVSEFTTNECMILFALQHTAKGTSIGRRKVKVPGEPRRRALLVGEGVTSYARLAHDSGLSRRTIRRFLPTLVEKLPWLKTQVVPRGHKEWGGIHFRLDFRKMRLWGASQDTCMGDSQTPTTVRDSQSPTGRPPLWGPARPQLSEKEAQLGSGGPPYETYTDQKLLSRAPLVVAAVLGDKSLDKQARDTIGGIINNWKTSNGEFTSTGRLAFALRKRLKQDPKRAIAQTHYVSQYQNPKCRLSMLLARLTKRWTVDPPDDSWGFARSSLDSTKSVKGAPERLSKSLENRQSKGK
jgi:hypothetical protein